MGTACGHARVSTREQSLDRRADALRGFGVEDARICGGKVLGRDFERPCSWAKASSLTGEGSSLWVPLGSRSARPDVAAPEHASSTCSYSDVANGVPT